MANERPLSYARDREPALQELYSGQYNDPLRVVAFNIARGRQKTSLMNAQPSSSAEPTSKDVRSRARSRTLSTTRPAPRVN